MKSRADEKVLFIHSSGTGPFLWAGVPDAAIGARRKLLPANLGCTPGEPIARGQHVTSTDDAVQVLKAVPQDGSRVHVVAHSYGALVALRAIPLLAERVASVFFYEPVAFALLHDAVGLAPEVTADMSRFLDSPWFLHDEERGGGPAWQEMFIDYWNRPGSWVRMPDAMRELTLAQGWKTYQEVRSCFFDQTPPGGWRLPAPTTIVYGDRTTPTSRAMSTRLADGRPNVVLVEAPGLGHMAPLTHATRVHDELARHMARFDEVTQ